MDKLQKTPVWFSVDLWCVLKFSPWTADQVASCWRLVGMNFSTHDLKYGSHPRSGGSKYTSISRHEKLICFEELHHVFGAKTPVIYDKYVLF